jgi:signal transduction histidine kinase
VLAERERIAQDLLGGTVHRLFGIGIELQAIATSTADERASERLQGSVGQLDQAITDLRSYVLGLRDRVDDQGRGRPVDGTPG